MHMRRAKLIASVFLSLSLVACSGSAPTRFHTLGTVDESVIPQLELAKRLSSLGVGPLKLPSLLDRQGLVLRRSDVSLDVSEQHQWGGLLKDEFLSALTQRLKARLPGARVLTVPWELEQTPRYQISVNISRFDGAPEGQAVLAGTWRLEQGEDGKILQTQDFRLSEAVSSETMSSMVQAQSRLLSQLADAMVKQLAQSDAIVTP